MTFTDKHIVETYAELFEGLNPVSKLELIDRLSKSLQSVTKKRENNFFKTFGAFACEKPSADIFEEIKSSRKFRKNNPKF
jgi:hypothetical protein